MICAKSGYTVASVFAIGFFAIGSSLLAQAPHFIGRNSCATATCHGGLIGDGPIWHSSASRWESSDPHRGAGESLKSELARRIVAGLEMASVRDSASFTKVLMDRCISCHAPETHPSTVAEAKDETLGFSNQLSRGVGCESCHGPASKWEKLHTQLDWNNLKQIDDSVGFRETDSLVARVDNCSRCHVGSRTADATVRDMNHDMIAAGHPVMAFDMYRYELALPKHWDTSKSGNTLNSPATLVSGAAAARALVLAATARLSSERLAAAASGETQCELSEFDCTACHHSILPISHLINSSKGGFPSWNSWLTLSNSLNFSTEMLQMSSPDLANRIALVGRESERRSQRFLTVKESDPLAFLRSSLVSALRDTEMRSQIVVDGKRVRAWFDQLEIAVHAASSQLNDNKLDRVGGIVRSFRANKLGESPDQSISGRILTIVSCNSGDIEDVCNDLLEVVDSAKVQDSKK